MKSAESIILVRTVGEFVQAIAKLPNASDRMRFFRGHSSSSHPVPKPGIYRNVSFVRNESNMIHEAIIRSPGDFSPAMNFFEKLVKLQHYGLPTRLLDLTSNALAALYFTCASREKTKGEVLVYDVLATDLKYYDSDTVAVLASLARRPVDFSPEHWPSDVEDFNSKLEIDRMVHDIRDDKPAFRHYVKKDDLFRVLCVRAKLDNARILRQDGAFLLYGIGKRKRFPAQIPQEWIVCGAGTKRIIVSNKYTIKRELERLGVSEQTLFPELDHQTQFIQDKLIGKYKRKPRKMRLKKGIRIKFKK